MAEQVESKPHNREYEEIEHALTELYSNVHWRRFMVLLERRRQLLMSDLAARHNDVRLEDIVRGRVAEISEYIAMDLVIAAREKEKRDGRQDPFRRDLNRVNEKRA